MPLNLPKSHTLIHSRPHPIGNGLYFVIFRSALTPTPFPSLLPHRIFSSCTLKVTGDQSALHLEMQSWQTGFVVVCLAKTLGGLPEGFTLSKRT